MTYQQEFLLFLSLLPLFLVAGMVLGSWIILRRLGGELRGYERPRLMVRGWPCRVVTESEYEWVKAAGRLRDVE